MVATVFFRLEGHVGTSLFMSVDGEGKFSAAGSYRDSKPLKDKYPHQGYRLLRHLRTSSAFGRMVAPSADAS